MHPTSKRFHELLNEIGSLHDSKQKDYGTNEDPLNNVRVGVEWGVPAWVGCMIRANDKVQRLKTMAIKGELANESVRDSFLDLATYALIGLILYEDEVGDVKETPDAIIIHSDLTWDPETAPDWPGEGLNRCVPGMVYRWPASKPVYVKWHGDRQGNGTVEVVAASPHSSYEVGERW